MLTARYGLIQSRNLRNASLISLPALRASRLVVSQSSRIFVFKSGSGRGGDGGPGRSSRVVGGDGLLVGALGRCRDIDDRRPPPTVGRLRRSQGKIRVGRLSARISPGALSPGARCDGPTSTSACWPTVLPSGIVALRGRLTQGPRSPAARRAGRWLGPA